MLHGLTCLFNEHCPLDTGFYRNDTIENCVIESYVHLHDIGVSQVAFYDIYTTYTTYYRKPNQQT